MHVRLLRFLAFPALLMVSLCAPAYATADTDNAGPGKPVSDPASVQQLETLLADIKTFEANVNQLIVESTGGVLEESEILFRLKRPNGFYWETLEPFPELIVTDGETLWNYQPDLLQVTVEPWQSERAELAGRLLNGEVGGITEEYAVSSVAVDNGDREFVLLPLDSGSMYERVTLYFAGDELDSIHIANGNGQKTLWQFYDRKINEPMDDALFTFIPPDDVEIVDNTGA